MENEFLSLQKFGFSQLAVRCYRQLSLNGICTASQLAKKAGCRPPNLYPPLKQLEQAGFVESWKTLAGPTFYRAVKVEVALKRYFKQQRQLLMPLIRAQQNSRE